MAELIERIKIGAVTPSAAERHIAMLMICKARRRKYRS